MNLLGVVESVVSLSHPLVVMQHQGGTELIVTCSADISNSLARIEFLGKRKCIKAVGWSVTGSSFIVEPKNVAQTSCTRDDITPKKFQEAFANTMTF